MRTFAHSGRVLEPYLNAERGVASCGEWLWNRSLREAPESRPPGTTTRARGGLAGAKATASSGDGSAAPEPKIATVERREAGVPRMGRKAPRKAPGLPRQVQAHRCLASTGRLSALRSPEIRMSEAKKNKTRAQKTRRGNEEVLT